jgi:hypothetical protein
MSDEHGDQQDADELDTHEAEEAREEALAADRKEPEAEAEKHREAVDQENKDDHRDEHPHET